MMTTRFVNTSDIIIILGEQEGPPVSEDKKKSYSVHEIFAMNLDIFFKISLLKISSPTIECSRISANFAWQ